MHQKRKSEPKQQHRYIEDVIFLTRTGVGYVAFPDKKDGEVKIENKHLNTAHHGDLVSVRIGARIREGMWAGTVEKVLARAKEEFVGVIHTDENNVYVQPQDPRFYTRIHIQEVGEKKTNLNQKVLVRITTWGKTPIGEIKEILGQAGEHETEIKAILRDRGVVSEFPPDVLHEAAQIEKNYPRMFEAETRHRRDMRNTPTFTVDPEDAKDFDDALSLKKLPNGNYEVGVHIADVSFFVKKGGALDREAARRSNTLYLVDRTVPMLPTALSENLCSLRPNEDRLTFSAIFEMTSAGNVTKQWFGKTIIHSRKRFTYEEAQGVLDTTRGAFHEELAVLNTIAKHMRTGRETEGALSFDHDEVKFELDANGVPLRVFRKKMFATNKLIEEFMVLANSEVARFMSGSNPNIKESFIYRVHDLPDAEKIKELERVMRALGYKVSLKTKHITSKDIAALLKQIEGAPHQEMIQMLTIRSLAKAVYTTKNIGHFGLSLKYYTHFTSPIRRYPDLIVHRMLFSSLRKEKIPLRELESYEAVSRYATEAEIAAQETERASVKYKQAEYMAARIGQTFDGVVTGLTERGIFVAEKETLSEGMVALRDLKDDYYLYDTKRVAIIGQKTKKKYSLGDSVKIKVKRVDIEARLIDYLFA